MEHKKQSRKTIRKIIITILGVTAVGIIFSIAPNYLRNEITNKTNLVVNSSNVTKSLKADVYIDDKDIVYISKEDVANYYDKYIYYDANYDQIVTSSETKLAALPVGKNNIQINSSNIEIYGTVLKMGDKYYLPFSELEKVYNVKTTYVKESDTVILESLDRELKIGNSAKKNNVKWKKTMFSKSVDNIEKGETVTILSELEEGWIKIRTARGKIGYIQGKDIANISVIRENMTYEKQLESNVNLVWDYFSEYAKAPNRSGTDIPGINVVSPAFFALKKQGKGEIEQNVGEAGKNYVTWAHEKNKKVWAIVSNNSMKETTSEIMKDYQLREKLINNIIELVVKYDLDGINIDFENMYFEDKELFSKFIIELAPRMRELRKVLSVDVTAPDGSETWSLCYNRNVLGEVADYIIFMAYDQNGVSSTTAGTTAGYDWVETNVIKFIKQEEVLPEKIVLGIPLYTRLWKESGGKLDSSVVSMKNVDKNIPNDVTKVWLEDLRQYYIEYEKNGVIYKMWIEDEKSIQEKFNLILKYKLAGSAFWAKDMEKEDLWEAIIK